MNNEIDELKNVWKDARKTVEYPVPGTEKLIGLAEKKKKSTVRIHVVNILILLVVLIAISAFFVFVARFNQTISHIGIALMTGGLAVRILIECFSIYLSTRINLTESVQQTNTSFLRFYRFRKKVHGPVTISIVILYTIGFYLLTPEFSLYFSRPMMLLIDGSYIVGAVIYTWSIRRAIRKEMGYLDELLKLQTQISDT